jgi:hypothetical protein
MRFRRRKHIHDVFLSHAVEDRVGFVDELYEKLTAQKLVTWHSGKRLPPGSDLNNTIKKAIDDSRFGVVVFSKKFLKGQWLATELAWLQQKENRDTKVILPVLYDLTAEELAPFYPWIAQKYCINSNKGVDYVVEKLENEIENELKKEQKRRLIVFTSLSVPILLFILAASTFLFIVTHDRPDDNQIKQTIDDRIQRFGNTIENRYVTPFKLEAVEAKQSKPDSAWSAYQNIKSYYRNEYEFNNGITTSRSRKNVEFVLQQNLVDLEETPGYGMDSLDIYWMNKAGLDGFRQSSYSFINKSYVRFSYNGEHIGSTYTVTVTFVNNIRYVNVSLTVPPTSNGTRRHEVTLIGFRPTEKFYFEKATTGIWQLIDVQ